MDVVLISMPWASVGYPSIQLGIVKSMLDRTGLSSAAMSFNLSFFEFLAARPEADRMSREQYDYVGEAAGLGIGKWVFAAPAWERPDSARDKAYTEYVRDSDPPHGVLDKAMRARKLVPEFLGGCAERVLAEKPRAVGFTSTFSQTFPSLALARMLKARNPDLRIVFGGANCDGPMGRKLHELYPWIDVVVRGESERVAAVRRARFRGCDHPPAGAVHSGKR